VIAYVRDECHGMQYRGSRTWGGLHRGEESGRGSCEQMPQRQLTTVLYDSLAMRSCTMAPCAGEASINRPARDRFSSALYSCH
jgi:hypothetical protein